FYTLPLIISKLIHNCKNTLFAEVILQRIFINKIISLIYSPHFLITHVRQTLINNSLKLNYNKKRDTAFTQYLFHLSVSSGGILAENLFIFNHFIHFTYHRNAVKSTFSLQMLLVNYSHSSAE